MIRRIQPEARSVTGRLAEESFSPSEMCRRIYGAMCHTEANLGLSVKVQRPPWGQGRVARTARKREDGV
jgi:hypothetical protein